jgi:predicted branched-subunit amino acid permease
VTQEHAAAPRLRDGVRAALPLAPSPILFGLSYGVLADATGFGRVAAIVMSATTFAGASQFASSSVLDAGGTVVAAALAAVFLNARYAAISLTVASIFPGGRLRRLVEDVATATVDDGSVAEQQMRVADPRRRGWLLLTSWVVSTAIGTVLGGVLEDPNALGLDAAFAALFLALAMPYLRNRRASRRRLSPQRSRSRSRRSRRRVSRSSPRLPHVCWGCGDERCLDRRRARRRGDDRVQGCGTRARRET